MKVARTVLNGESGSNAADLQNKKEESYPMYLMYLICLTVAYPLRNDEFCGCPRRQLLLCEQDALHLFD